MTRKRSLANLWQRTYEASEPAAEICAVCLPEGPHIFIKDINLSAQNRQIFRKLLFFVFVRSFKKFRYETLSVGLLGGMKFFDLQ